MSRRKRSWADRRRFQKRSMQAGEASGANLRVRGQDRLLFRVQLWGRRTTHFASWCLSLVLTSVHARYLHLLRRERFYPWDGDSGAPEKEILAGHKQPEHASVVGTANLSSSAATNQPELHTGAEASPRGCVDLPGRYGHVTSFLVPSQLFLLIVLEKEIDLETRIPAIREWCSGYEIRKLGVEKQNKCREIIEEILELSDWRGSQYGRK